jgi:hypothetical protein
MDNLAILFVILIMLIVILWTFSRSRRILENWAINNGYQILSVNIRLFRQGPFFLTTSKNQVVYYVTIQIPEGIKNGWVRCGSWWWGILQDKAEVIWDK